MTSSSESIFNDCWEIECDFAGILDDRDYDLEGWVGMEGSNEGFFIKPCVLKEKGGTPLILYGIYNRKTGIREQEVRQHHAAKTWADALNRATKGEKLPGLDPDSPPTVQ